MKESITKNHEGSQKTIMIALLAVAVILVALVSYSLLQKPTEKTPILDNNSGDIIDTVDANDIEADVNSSVQAIEATDQFRAEVPVNIVVPGVDTELSEAQKKEIALPVVVVPAAPGSSSSFRNFKITAENDAFTPTKVIANVGDTVHIDFTAIDKAYDIAFPSYNMKQSARQGETRILEFKARTEGNFTYYCPSCGGPESGPMGQIIIVAVE